MNNSRTRTPLFLIFFILFMLAPLASVAQDLLARQAPIDRRLKAMDSVALMRLKIKEALHYDYTENELYNTWDYDRVHCYNDEEVPDNYTIDLRGFAMPTDSRLVTSRYGYRATFKRQHKGLDIKVYIGDTIRSAFDGKVRIVKYEGSGYGNYVVIRHPNGLETIYGHLSKHLVHPDQIVRAGEPIGLGGNTGRSTGSHLHFETRLLGVAINPELMFNFPEQDVTSDFFTFDKHTSNHAATASN